MRNVPLIGFLALSLLWGSEWMLAASLPPQPVLLALAIRYAIAAIVLLPWAIRGRVWGMRKRGIVGAALTGACIMCLPQILIALSDKRLPPGLFLAALAAVPVLLAIGGRGTITTAVCGLAGVLFLTGNGLSLSLHQAPWLLLPLTAASALAWALTRAETERTGIPPAASLFFQCAVSALLFAAASRLEERQSIDWSASTVLGFTASAVVVAVCGYLLFFWLLSRLGASRLSMLQWTQTLVATTESAALMRIRPGWESIAGALLIVIAVILAFSHRDEGTGVMLQITQV